MNRIQQWKSKMTNMFSGRSINAIKRFLKNHRNNSYRVTLLSPCLLKEGDKGYEAVGELKWAFAQSDCRNIAVTGIFGAGKSSVIKTFIAESHLNKRKILSISLSNFCDKKVEEEVDETPLVPPIQKDDGNEHSYEDKIEYKIFQQILFKSNIHKTAKTSHRRISYLGFWQSALLISLVILWLTAFILIIQPEWIPIPKDVLEMVSSMVSSELQKYLLLAFGIVTLAVFVIITFELLRRLNHLAQIKLSVHDVKVDVQMTDSVFGKLLSEILYFFKAGEYKLVVFEDLDRINNPQALFLKLREINILLNESDYYKKHKRVIKFIYAIKDELFADEVRTKCFDYIISVVPIVDSYNAGDCLVQKYPEVMKGVDKTDLLRLGMYIPGKREMTSIVNEYSLHKSMLMKDNKGAKQLLAMVIYKNLFPRDYAKAYTKEGFLANVFLHKDLFYGRLIKEDTKKKEQYLTDLAAVKNSLIEKRKIFIDWLSENEVVQLVIGDSTYDIASFLKNDVLFAKFKNNEIDQCVCMHSGDSESRRTTEYTYTYEQISEDIDPDGTSDEEFDNLLSNQKTLERNLREISLRITSITKRPLWGICAELNQEEVQNTLQKILSSSYDEAEKKTSIQEAKMIEVLSVFIKLQYITEDYASYMSFPYEGELLAEDAAFIKSVLQDDPLPVEYTLKNVAPIIERFTIDDFKKESVLNFDLLNFMLSSKAEVHEAYLLQMIQIIRNNAQFIIDYAVTYPDNINFYQKLFDDWDGCLTQIRKLNDDEKYKTLLLYFKTAPKKISLIANEKKMVEQQYEFINQHVTELNPVSFKSYLRKYKFCFTHITEPTETSQWLYDEVLLNNHYQINQDNLRVICGDEFTKKSYTSILKLDGNVQRYISKDINLLVSLFPDSDVEESIDATINLLNDEKLKNAILYPYLKRQINHIDYDEERIPSYIARAQVLFETDIVNPVWKNIECLGTDLTNMKEFIVPFVKAHIDELGKQTRYTVGNPLRNLLMLDNETLTTDEFKKIITCFHYCFNVEDINDLNPDRIEIIIKSNYISYSLDGMAFASACSADLFASYLLGHFDQFINDKDFPIETLPNAVGIQILASNLSVKDKDAFLKKSLHIEDEDAAKYSEAVCKFYATDGDINSANIPEVLKALTFYQGGESWWDKIEIVNRINASIPYDLDTETQMLEALGGGYPALNHYRQRSKEFQRNDQNITLLTYLGQNHKYISKVFVGDDPIKVTFKNG